MITNGCLALNGEIGRKQQAISSRVERDSESSLHRIRVCFLVISL